MNTIKSLVLGSQLTCQGYSPVSVLCPPTILDVFVPLLGRPQSYNVKSYIKETQYYMYVLTARICFILWMRLYNFSRVGSHARTGRISAIFPEVLARNMNSTAVNCSAAPRSISINRGASVMDSVTINEGEHTVATGPRTNKIFVRQCA